MLPCSCSSSRSSASFLVAAATGGGYPVLSRLLGGDGERRSALSSSGGGRQGHLVFPSWVKTSRRLLVVFPPSSGSPVPHHSCRRRVLSLRPSPFLLCYPVRRRAPTRLKKRLEKHLEHGEKTNRGHQNIDIMFTVNGKFPEMDDVKLKQQYPASKLPDKYFFMHYEESLEWYFDPERCWNACFDNYQRLVLRPRGYLDWDFYCSILNTYEEDQAYVQYFEAVTNATKWIEDYLGDRTIKYEKIESVAYMQALEIAAGFPNVSPLLVSFGFSEFMCRIRSNYSHKGLDGLYFEIWKQVAIGKMSFKEALLEIHLKGMFPLRSVEIKHELENTPDRFPLKDYYDSLVADIDETASDDEVRQLFKEAVIEMASDPKHYLDYARKKLDIAKVIGLAPKGRRRGVAPQGKGDNGNGEAEVEIDH